VTLDEYLQQRGYQYRPAQGVEDGYGASWGKMQSGSGEGDYFDPLESSVTEQYYQDPTRFTTNRETQFGRGINTFDEGNEQQKKIIDQINSGQLYVSPKIERGRAEDQAYRESTSYELRDSKTGNVVNQQVIPIDPSKGIFNVVADDPNSSGFFNNYVSTDPKGFVNPIVSPEQSQYSSRKNSSADFYRNAVLSSLAFTGLAFPGLGEALGAATGLGTVGGNVALNTGINAIKQGVSGQFNPLGLATSAALSYGMQGGFEGADPLTADDLYTGQAMQNLSNQAAVNMDMDWQVPPEYETEPQTGLDFGQPNDIAGAQELARQRQFEDAISQTQDVEDYERGATSGEVPKGTGPLGNVYEPSPTMSLANLLKMTTSAIPKATVSKLPSAINTGLNTAQNMQQQSNLANMLRGTQMAQTALPAIYKQANPFNFGQQNQPVQDTNALVKLLRTA
jgi:hypothetical protein